MRKTRSAQKSLRQSLTSQNPFSSVKDSSTGSKSAVLRFLTGTLAVILVAGILCGGFLFSDFFIVVMSDGLGLDWFNPSNAFSWIASVAVILVAFGTLRYCATFVTRLFKFVFKFAQSDIVTIALAVFVNLLYLLLDWWMTGRLTDLMMSSGFESYATRNESLSFVTLLVMIAGALVWIPRVGVYGENAIARVLDEDGF